MEVLHPKKLETHPGEQVIPWARRQLELAREILDNPGGGLLFATLAQAEDLAVHREFDESRRLLAEALQKLTLK